MPQSNGFTKKLWPGKRKLQSSRAFWPNCLYLIHQTVIAHQYSSSELFPNYYEENCLMSIQSSPTNLKFLARHPCSKWKKQTELLLEVNCILCAILTLFLIQNFCVIHISHSFLSIVS